MGERTRNHYTKEFKFKVAIAAIKGEKQLSELAAEFKVNIPVQTCHQFRP